MMVVKQAKASKPLDKKASTNDSFQFNPSLCNTKLCMNAQKIHQPKYKARIFFMEYENAFFKKLFRQKLSFLLELTLLFDVHN